MDIEKRYLTWRRPQMGNFNLASFPLIADKFAGEFRAMGFNWIPSDVDVEFDRTWLSVFRRMEGELRDNPDMLWESQLPIILDTAIQFYLRGWIQARKDKHLYRKEYKNE